MNYKLIFGLVFALLLLAVPAMADLKQDNVIYYGFNNDYLVEDLTGNGNDGTNVGATTGVAGILNEAFDFDGTSDSVQIDSSITSGPISVSLWANADTIASNEIIFDQGYSRFWIAYDYSGTGGMECGVYDGSSKVVSTGHDPTTGWAMYTATVDASGNLNCYINGVLNGTIASGGINQAVTAQTLGSNSAESGNRFDGQIDEFSLYSKVLSASEVAELYNSGTGYSLYDETPLMIKNSAYYSFDGNTEDTETYIGTPIGTDGILNGIIDFDGTADNIEIGDILDAETAISISGWFKADTSGSANEFLVSNRASASTNYIFMMADQTDGYSCKLRYSGTVLSANEGTAQGTNWQYVTCIYNSTGAHLYINGSLINSDTAISASPTPTSASGTTYIAERGDNSGYFNGKIDDLIITNDVITVSEMTAIYASGAPTQGANETVDNILYYSSMDSLYDWSGTSNFPAIGATGHMYTNSGKLNGALDWDGSADYLVTGDIYNSATANRTISTWVNRDATGDYFFFWSGDTSGKTAGHISTNDLVYCQANNAGGNVNAVSTSTIGTGTWNHIVCRWNGTDLSVWINGTEEASSAIAGPLASSATGDIGRRTNNNDRHANGQMDEWSAWTRALTSSEISDLYNAGDGNNFYTASTPAPGTETVTSISPVDNDFNNTYSIDFQYNTTNTTGAVTSCTLYIDGSANQTDSSVTPDTTQTINSNFTADGSYSWLVGCTIAGTEYNSTARTLTLDSVQPTINTGSLSNLMPVTYGILGGDLLQGQINLSDDNLYSLNVSTDVETIYYNNSISPLTTFNYTLSHNISAYAQGLHTVTIKAADGHTTKKIDEYNYKKSLFSKELKFDFKNDEWFFTKDYVSIEVDKGTLDTQKLLDRYVFDWESTQSQSTVKFTVKSDHYIDIIHDSKYPGHLIVPGLDKWIDFAIENPTGNEKYDVTRISENEVEVKVSQLDKDKATFKSIGDLNINTLTYTFYVINATETYVSPTVEGATTDFVLNFEANSTYTITANFTYDGTTTTITPSSTATNQVFTHSQLVPSVATTPLNKEFYWQFDIDSVYNNQTDTQNQTVHQFLIDDCSAYTTQAYNITFKNEETFAEIGVNSSILIEYNYTNQSRTYGQSFTEDSNIAFCVSPAWANVTGDITLQYNYNDANRDFITSQTRFDNSTEYQDVYILLSGGTEVTVTVVDTDDNPQQNVIVEAWRYNLSNAEFYMVESEITDPDGRSIFTLVQNNPFYKFLIYQDGDLELETDKFKITQTDYQFVIGEASTSPVATWIRAKSISASVSYDNATDTVTYNWTDSGNVASLYCLNLTYDNGTGVTYSCSTTSSSSLTYVITDQNSTYSARGIATVGGQDKLLDSISISLGGAWRELGTNFSLGIAFVMFLILALIGVWSPVLSLIMTIVSMISLYMVGLVPLGMTALIGFIMVGFILMMLTRERLGA